MPPSLLRRAYLVLALLACLLSFPVLQEGSAEWQVVIVVAIIAVFMHGALSLLTMELVWGTRRFGRLLTYWGWIIAGTFCYSVPVCLFARSDPERFELMWGIYAIPAMLLSAQIPFWILRYLARIRLTRIGEEDVPADRWSIRDFGVSTILLAGSLAAARFAATDPAVELDMAAIAIAMGVYPLFFAVPTALCVLRPRSDLGAIACTVLQLVVLEGLMVSIVFLDSSSRNGEPMLVALIFFLGPATAFACLRWAGYRLIWRGETNIPCEISKDPETGCTVTTY